MQAEELKTLKSEEVKWRRGGWVLTARPASTAVLEVSGSERESGLCGSSSLHHVYLGLLDETEAFIYLEEAPL